MITVLIVDDEPRTARGLEETIPWSELGVQKVDTATNGSDALQKLRAASASILLTDIRMPRMDGLELSKAVASEYPDTKIIFMSAHADFEYAKAALTVGAVDYIVKPIDHGEVIDVVDRVVSMIGTPAELSEPEIDTPPHPFVTEPAKTDRRVIRDIRHFVAGQLDKPIGLQEVADAIHLSPPYTSALFRRECGITITAYIAQAKIDKATELIRARDYYTVSELAERLGFSDYRYFTRVFKRHLGVTPTQYSRESREQ